MIVAFTEYAILTNRPHSEVYTATFKKVVERNVVYYKKYPDDINSMHKLINFLAENHVKLPGGGVLTPEVGKFLSRIFRPYCTDLGTRRSF